MEFSRTTRCLATCRDSRGLFALFLLSDLPREWIPAATAWMYGAMPANAVVGIFFSCERIEWMRFYGHFADSPEVEAATMVTGERRLITLSSSTSFVIQPFSPPLVIEAVTASSPLSRPPTLATTGFTLLLTEREGGAALRSVTLPTTRAAFAAPIPLGFAVVTIATPGEWARFITLKPRRFNPTALAPLVQMPATFGAVPRQRNVRILPIITSTGKPVNSCADYPNEPFLVVAVFSDVLDFVSVAPILFGGTPDTLFGICAPVPASNSEMQAGVIAGGRAVLVPVPYSLGQSLAVGKGIKVSAIEVASDFSPISMTTSAIGEAVILLADASRKNVEVAIVSGRNVRWQTRIPSFEVEGVPLWRIEASGEGIVISRYAVQPLQEGMPHPSGPRLACMLIRRDRSSRVWIVDNAAGLPSGGSEMLVPVGRGYRVHLLGDDNLIAVDRPYATSVREDLSRTRFIKLVIE